ncbi:uncharacterized protein LOC109529968 [Hippocampus comes]|uniref:uncharacterized protein LOC109529968 n=1 Tax=Hippocampus comes TaxID=109280 RepID=UPI00094EA23D|nr:PREDICTED: uncharacterized protein LOC109529968 [Hippocampus comes]
MGIYFPGIPSHDLQGTNSPECYAQLSWSLAEFNNYICQSFPSVSLNVIGFHLARADKSRRLTRIQANTLKDLKTAVGRSRLYILPQTNITLPLEIAEFENTHAVPETSQPTEHESLPQYFSPPLSTTLMASPTATSTATRPEVSPSTQSRPPASSALSSSMNNDGSSASTGLDSCQEPSLESSLDSAQWLNAGTPEVFYRVTCLESTNRYFLGLETCTICDTEFYSISVLSSALVLCPVY